MPSNLYIEKLIKKMNFRVNINVCRVCMKAESGVSLHDDSVLNQKFVFTTRLKITKSDDVPSLICYNCQKRLRISYDFVKLAHESDKNLRDFLIKISKDFQLVASNVSNKDRNNEGDEDDDDLLSTIAVEDDDSLDKTANATDTNTETQIVTKKVVMEVKSPPNKNTTERSFCEIQDSTLPEQEMPKDSDRTIMDMEKVDTKESGSKLLKANVKIEKEIAGQGSEEYNLLEPDLQADIREEETKEIVLQSNNKDDTNSETHNDQIPNGEMQILEYTDEDSQTELEILEERDGYLKEYQAILEEDVEDEYIEDANVISNNTTGDEIVIYESKEDLLDDTDHKMGVREEQPNSAEEHDGIEIKPQSRFVVENVENAREAKRKVRKGPTKTNTRAGGTTAKSTGKDDCSTSSERRYFCYKCNRDFSTKTNLTRHLLTHEGKRPFQCNVCSKGFTQNASLKQHMYIHTGEKPYQCEICERSFTQCKSLVFHRRRHSGNKPFPCEECGTLFRQKDGLKTHILKRHTIKSQQGNTELITCTICKEKLPDNSSLQDHMKKHLSDYVRVDSAMSYSNREAHSTDEKNELMMDYDYNDDQYHNKEPVYFSETVTDGTDIINEAAHVVDIMTTSAMEPSRAKKFQCRKCFKCFAIKKNLLRHLTTHDINVATTEDLYCKLCDLRFVNDEGLQSHTLREHNSFGEMHQCELCQLLLPSAVEMQKHSLLEHSFKCQLCTNIQFTSQRQLTNHNMMEHELNKIY